LKDPFPEIADNLAKEMLGEQYPDVKLPYAKGQKPDLSFGKAVIRDYANSRVIERLSLYERRIESSLFRTTGELERRKLMRQTEDDGGQTTEDRGQKTDELKKQSQNAGLRPEARSTKLEILNNTKCPENGNLKKQSQLPDSMDVSYFVKDDYENKLHPESNENKSKFAPLHECGR
jgi:hypothetical protein